MKQIFFIIFIFVTSNTFSLEVTVSQGTIKPTPIAVTNFFSSDNKLIKIGKNISLVISNNLEMFECPRPSKSRSE